MEDVVVVVVVVVVAVAQFDVAVPPGNDVALFADLHSNQIESVNNNA